MDYNLQTPMLHTIFVYANNNIKVICNVIYHVVYAKMDNLCYNEL